MNLARQGESLLKVLSEMAEIDEKVMRLLSSVKTHGGYLEHIVSTDFPEGLSEFREAEDRCVAKIVQYCTTILEELLECRTTLQTLQQKLKETMNSHIAGSVQASIDPRFYSALDNSIAERLSILDSLSVIPFSERMKHTAVVERLWSSQFSPERLSGEFRDKLKEYLGQT